MFKIDVWAKTEISFVQEVNNRSTIAGWISFITLIKRSLIMLQCFETKFKPALVCSELFITDTWSRKNRELVQEVDTLDKKQANAAIHKVWSQCFGRNHSQMKYAWYANAWLHISWFENDQLFLFYVLCRQNHVPWLLLDRSAFDCVLPWILFLHPFVIYGPGNSWAKLARTNSKFSLKISRKVPEADFQK